ncbi:CopG family transcriptional regulator [Paenirhodobacter sp.]|uniref:CopG family transcriptional regulator n=1 Tax=Paenirhodobacter sp. TaxID=1965326 RepID=UPI003B40DB8E
MTPARTLREKTPDSEKITLNLGFVDLGRIDLLVQEGFYSNRSDFIRTAIRNQLDSHGEVVSRSIQRNTMELGLRDYSRAELEALRDAGEVLHVKVVGLARIAPDVAPELAAAVIGSITVLGALQASTEVRQALAGRIH